MEKKVRKQIIALLKKEVIPAIGCTEPVAVALAVAKATELLARKPERIDVFLSANVLKNAMGVGIPGTGMVGLPIAVALGALIGKSAYALEVLRDITSTALEEGKAMIAAKKIGIFLKENVDKLYIEAVCRNGEAYSKAIIAGEHTRFVYIEKNRDVLVNSLTKVDGTLEPEPDDAEYPLCFNTVYEFSMNSPLDEICFILEAAQLNRKAAEEAGRGDFGHSVGRIVSGRNGRKYLGDSPLTHMLSLTSAACDVRMGGAMVPVMSNSGSGNQGIAATLPVLSFAEDIHCSEEQLIRSLMLSHLMVVYIKQNLGRLSALCGCVVAATGASCGITYLMGGTREQISYAIKNMIGNLTGMICDGAKPSCAMKVSSGVSTAMLSALMAMENRVVTEVEGIIDNDVDISIRNLTEIGSVGMETTDRMVLDIMTGKSKD
ncbi:MAG: L-serine ammonia-lyase, iron-sulfur-dependent, subunit alpha [Massilibacteroides sp.]|nr:L-serine ammonia-lyase, iron-sulfur-dependent, subunit alpha [Massilibacteroides sp.]MDD4659084.1 L-serine ammonia-lyase, iron-sulfur-dependent, subunit alpha [Massilibacteroides sp.]